MPLVPALALVKLASMGCVECALGQLSLQVCSKHQQHTAPAPACSWALLHVAGWLAMHMQVARGAQF
jgi:hypothetical protein